MRIISGTARGCKLTEFTATEIRPTPDRVREALFSIIISKLDSLVHRTVLDLFAGTGAMGLEALSRGAASVIFVDQSKEAAGLIQKNAVAAKLFKKANILQTDVQKVITNQPEPFDLIFMDPPYANQDVEDILLILADKKLLKQGGIICVETAHATPLPFTVSTLVQVDRRKYGSTSISLYEYGDFQQ